MQGKNQVSSVKTDKNLRTDECFNKDLEYERTKELYDSVNDKNYVELKIAHPDFAA